MSTPSIHDAIVDIACRAWVATAFRRFIARDGRRGVMLGAIALQTRRVVTAIDADARMGSAACAAILQAVASVDDGNAWHEDLGLPSYVDVGLQLKVLRAFAGLGDGAMVERILVHFPDSRPALLAHAEILIETGRPDEALPAIERALRVQAVCPTAQGLLLRARGGDEVDAYLRDRFCSIPFLTLSTGYKGAAFACTCPAWVPYPIGNVLEARTAEEIWNSDVAQEIRRSILDGDFSYCSRTLCSFIAARKLPARADIVDPEQRRIIAGHVTRLPLAPGTVDLNYDSSCNLACPSCRTDIISASSDEQVAFARARDRVILPLLRGVKGQTYISGGGEAFASKHYRSILAALNRAEYPGLKVFLITNGLLLTPQRWRDFPRLGEMVGVLSVSIDAARAATYERLRRPGRWSTLLANLEFIAELRRTGVIQCFWINFVVQKANYREMLEFVELGDHLGVDKIWFQRVTNYGSYDEATFREVDVTAADHPEHGALLDVLRRPVMQRTDLDLYMLMSLAPETFADAHWDAPLSAR